MNDKKTRRMACNDFFYSNGTRKFRLSEWKNVYGKQASFTFSLGSQERIIVTDQQMLNGVKQLATLIKV